MDLFDGKPTYEQLEARVEELEAMVAQLTRKPASVRQRRFPDFWMVYPNKKGKREAEKAWDAKKLDGIAEQLIGHVLTMVSSDDGWQRGYAPMGSTYLNQERWTDVPQAAPLAAKAAPSNQMQAMMALGGYGGLDRRGNPAGPDAVDVSRPALGTGSGHDAGYAHGMGQGRQAQPGVGSGFGYPALPGRVFDHDG